MHLVHRSFLSFLALIFILISCGKSKKSLHAIKQDSTQQQAKQTETKSQKPVHIKVGKKEPFGAYLTDGSGRSLYLFLKDSTKASTCYESCAATWPPVLTGSKSAIKISTGVDSSLVGTTKRKNGDLQLTYNHHPIYYYIVDQKAGQFSGQDIDQYGAEWYLVKPNGKKMGDVRE